MNPAILIAAMMLLSSAMTTPLPAKCPEGCTCTATVDHSLKLTCDSYDFLAKLTPKQSARIIALNLTNLSLTHIDAKLKYLKNLEVLDLSNNEIAVLPTQFPRLAKLATLNLSKNFIKTVQLNRLPASLANIDLSQNALSQLPENVTHLDKLRTIRLDHNPFACDCLTVDAYALLVRKYGESVPVVCDSPHTLRGRPIALLNCSLIMEFLMMGDEADAGSGDLEPVVNWNDSNEENVSLTLDEGLLPAEEDIVSKASVVEDTNEGSGSGDEGFATEDYIETIKACLVNCSTPKPIGSDDAPDASPPPDSFIKQMKMALDGLNFLDRESVVTTKAPVPTTEVEAWTESSNQNPTSAPASENHENINKESLLKKDVETIPTNDTVVGEMERASVLPEATNSHTVYVVIGIMVVIVVFSVIFYVHKRSARAQKPRSQNGRDVIENGEEMKPLKGDRTTLPVITPVQMNAASTPLLSNGQSERGPDGERIPEVDNNQEEDVAEPLQKVKITSAETPETKTPLRVHRQTNNDGQIVTTIIG